MARFVAKNGYRKRNGFDSVSGPGGFVWCLAMKNNLFYVSLLDERMRKETYVYHKIGRISVQNRDTTVNNTVSKY